MNTNINLNLYKYFYEVAKYNSFTKAAESLMISQPSLSYSIKTLENQLGKKLFTRNKNKILLTEDGKIIYDKLKSIFDIFNSIILDNENISGKVILGVRSAVSNKMLPFYISELNKIYPELEIEFVIAPSKELMKKLVNKEIDLLIDEYQLDGDYVSNLIYADDTIFFTTISTYKNSKSKVIDIDYLKKNPICIIKRNRISNEIQKKYPSFNYLTIQSTPLMLNKMKDNNLIGISPKAVIEEELENGSLIKLESSIELPKSKLFISYIKRLENNKIKVVVDFIKEHNYYQLLKKGNIINDEVKS
ncbi:MAG: LysR family transcriptional regulator [Bacilli bacterium]|nr:LysR family transcriptional regulator [Bacilli bacterium]